MTSDTHKDVPRTLDKRTAGRARWAIIHAEDNGLGIGGQKNKAVDLILKQYSSMSREEVLVHVDKMYSQIQKERVKNSKKFKEVNYSTGNRSKNYSLVPCHNCGHEIFVRAAICPNCGLEYPAGKKRDRINKKLSEMQLCRKCNKEIPAYSKNKNGYLVKIVVCRNCGASWAVRGFASEVAKGLVIAFLLFSVTMFFLYLILQIFNV